MPRFLQAIALGLVLLLVGVPTVVAEVSELMGDDCADECAGEREDEDCSEQGCTDCSVVCSSCPRTHVVASSMTGALVAWRTPFVNLSTDVSERVPDGPPPQGVFHPPRTAG